MIIIKKKIFGLTATQKWFPKFINVLDFITITMYKQVDLQIKSSCFYFKEKAYTLHSNLDLPEEEILKKFNSTIRNEVRRADKEGNSYKYAECKDIFLNIFNDFASKKGISCQSTNSLDAYGDNLILTSTCINNITTVVHSYLIDSDLNKVRLLHSATKRFSDDLNRNLIARSNKYLHFMDMMIFKKKGFVIYDWGGIAFGTENKSLLGINKFKESFGGQLIEQKNLYSPLYKLTLEIRSIYEKIIIFFNTFG